ncbi:MAG: hypothetical protein AAB592_02955 [Patescibacteria group bacterium]
MSNDLPVPGEESDEDYASRIRADQALEKPIIEEARPLLVAYFEKLYVSTDRRENEAAEAELPGLAMKLVDILMEVRGHSRPERLAITIQHLVMDVLNRDIFKGNPPTESSVLLDATVVMTAVTGELFRRLHGPDTGRTSDAVGRVLRR